MNSAQIHLALNHAPLFLSIIGGGILILGMIRKNESFKILSLYLLVAAAIFTLPVFFSGEGTEELVEDLAGVNKDAIEKHEGMAKISLFIILITGLTALSALFLKMKTKISSIFLWIALFLSLASFGAMAQTAHFGGLIRHSELTVNATINTELENEEENMDNDKAIRLHEKNVKDSLKQIEKTKKENDDD